MANKDVTELKTYIGRPEAELPEHLKALANSLMLGIPGFPWDGFTPDQRLELIEQEEIQANPSEQYARAFTLVSENEEIEKAIRELELMRPQTPTEFESRERQLTAYRKKLQELEQERQKLGNSATVTTPEAPTSEAPPQEALPAPRAKTGPKGPHGPSALKKLLRQTLLDLRKKLKREPTTDEVWNALPEYDKEEILDRDETTDQRIRWTSANGSPHSTGRKTVSNYLSELRKEHPFQS